MVHLRPVILALLFALAAPVAASVGVTSTQPALSTPPADVQVYAPEGTSSAMTLGEGVEETRAFAQPTVDLGTTLASETDLVERRIVSHSLNDQFASAKTRDEKRDLLLKSATDIDSRLLQLEQREQAARMGLQNGSVSGETYLRTVARIDAEAKSLKAEINQVELYTNDVEQFSMTSILRNLDKRLLSLESPVSDRVLGAITGNESTLSIYVSVADNGVILSTIEDGVYVREVFRADYQSDGDGQITSDEAAKIIDQTYPWVWENLIRKEWNGIPSSGYQRYAIDHRHGRIVSYIDTTNQIVFIERQTIFLTKERAAQNQVPEPEKLPKGPGDMANESGLILTANRSYPGGPMYIALTNETGSPVEGTITVDGDERGQTTTDGGLWTLSPAGSFNVTATVGLDEATVETRAMRPITRQTNSSKV